MGTYSFDMNEGFVPPDTLDPSPGSNDATKSHACFFCCIFVVCPNRRSMMQSPWRSLFTGTDRVLLFSSQVYQQYCVMLWVSIFFAPFMKNDSTGHLFWGRYVTPRRCLVREWPLQLFHVPLVRKQGHLIACTRLHALILVVYLM